MVLSRISKFLLICIILFSAIFCEKKKEVVLRDVNKVFFLSNRDAPKREFDLFSMNLDGSDQINLTKKIDGIRSFSKPAVSYDGNVVLFVATGLAKKKLYSLQISDSTLKVLTEINVDNPHAQFSPDGKSILFTDLVNGKSQLFLMNDDGSNRKNISNNEYNDREPKFSKDASKICFTRAHNKNSSIGIMEPDGSNQEILTDNKGNETNPSFSPDGSLITFCSNRAGTSDIYYMDVSDQNIINIASSQFHESDPQFAPNGEDIFFISNAQGVRYRHLMLVNIISKKITNLTPDLNNYNQNFTLMPNGRSVIFESIQYEDSEIYQLDIDSLKTTNLSNHPKWDLSPAL